MVKRVFSSCSIIFIFMLLGMPLLAQDSQVEQAASSTEQVSEQADEPSNDNSDNRNTNAEDQVFVPSEEISEDAPVAFPVDI